VCVCVCVCASVCGAETFSRVAFPCMNRPSRPVPVRVCARVCVFERVFACVCVSMYVYV